MNSLHLDGAALALVGAILARLVPGCEVLAFGSRVTGARLKRFSDLDLAVRAPHPVDPMVLSELRHAFSESDLVIKVDVVDWAGIGPGLRDEIARAHVVIQHGAGTAAMLHQAKNDQSRC